MKAGTMEGLIGAGINMKLVDTPMRVFKEARRKGDLGAMERAMGYANEFKNTAYEYKEQAEEELRKEMEENREEQKREQAKAIEERRKANKEAQNEAVEKLAAKAEKMRDGSEDTPENTTTQQSDSLVISPEGHKLLEENRPATADIEAPDMPAPTDTKFYSSAGTSVEPAPVGMNVSVDV